MIVLDIMLTDMDGYEVCREIRNMTMAPILFLSAKSDETDKIISFAVGGDDYLTKPFSPREVVAHINAALRRLNYYESGGERQSQVAFGEYILDLDRRELYKDGQPVNMTSKEYLLLEYLVKNRNVTVSREKLIEQVWGGEYEGYDNTVTVHIRHVREKIESDPSSPRFLKTVKGRGYRFEIPEDTDLPQYLIRSAGQYISISDGKTVDVDDELTKRMEKYGVWLQVLDSDGEQIYASGVPDSIPTKYNSYELLDACLKSDAIEGYTLFAVELESCFGELRKLDEKLKSADRLRAEWIANISHDIKTPLSTIRG